MRTPARDRCPPLRSGRVSSPSSEDSFVPRTWRRVRSRGHDPGLGWAAPESTLAWSAGPRTAPGIRSGGGPVIADRVRQLAYLGVGSADSDTVRAQKAALTIAVLLVTGLAVIWVATYWFLGIPQAAAIPFVYQVASVTTLVIFARTKNYRFVRAAQAAMMLSLPFLLQWTLGGFVASSAVSLWALIAAFGTLFYFTTRESIPWFVAFLCLTAISGLIEPLVSRNPAAIPEGIRTTFFVLNVSGVSLTAYVLLQYAVRTRDEAFARSDRLLLNVLPPSIAERLKRDPGVIADSHDAVTVLF